MAKVAHEDLTAIQLVNVELPPEADVTVMLICTARISRRQDAEQHDPDTEAPPTAEKYPNENADTPEISVWA